MTPSTLAPTPSYASMTSVRSSGVSGIDRLNQVTGQPTGNRQRRSSIMYGTSKTGTSEGTEFLAADVALVATGVSKEASAEQLKEFVISKGIGVISVEKLTREDIDTRTNTFKVVIKLADYEKAMNPEMWPYRVGVRHFRAPKRQGISWSHQTGQTRNGQHTGQQAVHQYRQNTAIQNRAPQHCPSPFSLELRNRYQALADSQVDVFNN